MKGLYLSNEEILLSFVNKNLIFLLKINTKNFNLYAIVVILCLKKNAINGFKNEF